MKALKVLLITRSGFGTLCHASYAIENPSIGQLSKLSDSLLMHLKSILIIGVFWSAKTRNKVPRSAPDQLAELLMEKGLPVLRTSFFLNKYLRFADTLFTILFKAYQYDIAIVPWFNGLAVFIGRKYRQDF